MQQKPLEQGFGGLGRSVHDYFLGFLFLGLQI